MAGEEFTKTFIAHVDQNVRQMKRLADRAMVLFIVLRLGLVVGSAALPALTAFAEQRWATAFAIGIAILAGLDTQFHWGEEWRHFRSAQLTLERLRRDYDHGLASIMSGRSAADLNSNADVFERFYQSVGLSLQTEQERFFKFRIVEWKEAPAK